jgi:hypothetical protein
MNYSSWPYHGELLTHEGMSSHKKIETKLWTKRKWNKNFYWNLEMLTRVELDIKRELRSYL